jgi:protein-disulfide isomerase
MTLNKLCGTVAALIVAGSALSAGGQEKPAVDQDPQILRLVSRAVIWYPDSNFSVSSNDRGLTPAGSYRLVSVNRACANDFLSGETTVLIDDAAEVAWIGSVGELPLREAGVEAMNLRPFLEDFLPQALLSSMRVKVSLDWNTGPRRPGALIPFWLRIDTGYGDYRKEAAVTADGAYVVIGSRYPLDSDPVEYRRQMLASSAAVVWDHPGEGAPAVEIVEFSDLECPACRAKWPVIKEVLNGDGKGGVRHGMVSFPLTTIHPWAFRAASASWCIAAQDAPALMSFKELFYELQPEMEVSQVTPTALDFVAGNGLDEAAFKSCYLRQESLDGVHSQLALGNRIGVVSTPTYFVNGWMVVSPDPAWFEPMIESLIAGEDPL